MRRPWTASLHACLLIAWSAAAAAPVVTSIDPDAEGLPYRPSVRWSVSRYTEDQPFMHGAGTSGMLMADVNGDGADERVTARDGAVQVHSISSHGAGRSLWWHNLPPDFSWGWPTAAVLGVTDADGDGRNELLVVGQDRSTHLWRLWALDGATGDRVLQAELLPTSERREDGIWDGAYGLAGALTVPTASGPRPAYVLFATAGHDLAPRGLLAVDAADGRHLWFLPTAGKPAAGACRVVDLENDGVDEILLVTAAVSNYPADRSLDGLRDDAVRIRVVEADGRERWRRSQGVQPGTGGVLTLDLDGDGILEVLDWTSHPLAGTNRITARRAADGGTVAVLEVATPIMGAAVLPRRGDPTPRVLLSRHGAGIELFAWRDGTWRLERNARAPFQLSVRGVADLLPHEGPEVIAVGHPGRLLLLGRDLELLGATPPGERIAMKYDVVKTEDGGRLLMAFPNGERGGSLFAWTEARRDSRAPLLLLGAVPLIAAGAVALHRRRSRRTAPVFGRREARLQLLGQLELAGHGAIGLLKTLRRVVWLGRAAAVSPEETWPSRLFELGREFLERAVPAVDGLLRLADAADLEPRVVLRAKESLALAQKELAALHAAAYDRDELAARLPDLAAAADDLENDLQRLRREVGADFRTDLAAVVERVLSLLQEELEAGGVTAARQGEPQAWVRCDPEELAFVLDDLVQNALRAMAPSGGGRLTLAWREDAGALVLDVGDTGVGIVPDDWDRVFDVGYSTRQGGGLGLSRSRDLLRKYEGRLAVHASEPGRGTTMRLRLPRAPAPD